MRLRSVIGAAGLAAAFVAVILVLAVAGHGRAPAAHSSAAGAPRSLRGTTLTGRRFDLTTLRGRRVVINFFAQWCPPCNAEAPDLAAFAKAHPDIAFVGVDVNDQAAKGRAFVHEYGLTYQVVSDPRGAIAAAWGVTSIPTTFFIDGGGVERAVTVGATSRQTFEEKLKDLP